MTVPATQQQAAAPAASPAPATTEPAKETPSAAATTQEQPGGTPAAPAQTPPAAPAVETPKEGKGEPAAPAPKEIDYSGLALGDKSLLSDKDLDAVKELAKANGWSAEAAGKVLAGREEAVTAFWNDQLAKHEEYVKQSGEDLKKRFGDRMPEACENSKRCVEKFGSKELAEKLEATKYGTDPDLVALLDNIWQAVGKDDRLVTGGATGGADSIKNPQKRLEAIYAEEERKKRG